jgi:hypothetical protein
MTGRSWKESVISSLELQVKRQNVYSRRAGEGCARRAPVQIIKVTSLACGGGVGSFCAGIGFKAPKPLVTFRAAQSRRLAEPILQERKDAVSRMMRRVPVGV